jgi:MFS family permease
VPFRPWGSFDRGAASRLRRNLRLSTLDACTAAPIVYINVGGNFIIAGLVTQVFGIDHRTYGWIASLPAWCYALQLILVPLVAHRFTSRQFAIYGALASAIVWAIFTAGLFWLPRDSATSAARIIFAVIGFNCLAQSFASVGWTAWVQDWLPQRVRGKYFGFRYRAMNLATVAFFLFVGWITSALSDGVRAYQLVFGVATLARFFSVIFQIRMATPREEAHVAPLEWRSQMARLRRDKSFMNFVWFGTLAAFVMNLTNPFYPVFAYESLGLTVDQYSLMALLATVGGAVIWPWWGRMADLHGCRNVITLSLCGWSLLDFCWPFLRAGHALWPLYCYWLANGGVACGFLVGSLNWLLKLMPAGTRVAGVSLNLAMNSLAAAVAPILAGSILQAAHRAGPAQNDLAFRILFFVKPILQMLTLLVLRHIVEPEGTPFAALLAAVRAPYRALVAPGRPFLEYIQLSRPEKPPPPPPRDGDFQ